MNRGAMLRAWDYLFADGKTIDQDTEPSGALGFIDMQVGGLDSTAIQAGNPSSQIAANKGTIHACVRLIGFAVANQTIRTYRVKAGMSSSKFLVTKVREVPLRTKRELLLKAAPGTALAMANDLEEIVGNHRLVDLLHNVSGYLDPFGLKYITATYLALVGNCYWVLLKDDKYGLPSSIWIAPAEYMRVKPDSDNLVGGYIYRRGTKVMNFEPDEVVHFKLPAPGSQFQFYGRGDVLGALDPYNLRQYIQRFEEAIFRNGANVGGVLSTKSRTTKDQRDQLRNEFQMVHASETNAGKWMVMQDVEPHPLSMTPRELAYQSARKTLMEEMAANMGVPIAMLTGQSTTRAALDASLTQFAMFSSAPYCTLISEALNAQLTPLYPDSIVTEIDNPIPEDREFQLKQEEADVKMGARSIDEIRMIRGLELLGGNATEPMVDASRVPLSMAGQMSDSMVGDIAERALSIARKRMKA